MAMTEIEAHQFIARWSRRLITWNARNEVEQLRDLERSCIGSMAGSFLMAFTIPFFPHAIGLLGILALGVFGSSLWMVVHLRSARRALKSKIENLKS